MAGPKRKSICLLGVAHADARENIDPVIEKLQQLLDAGILKKGSTLGVEMTSEHLQDDLAVCALRKKMSRSLLVQIEEAVRTLRTKQAYVSEEKRLREAMRKDSRLIPFLKPQLN